MKLIWVLLMVVLSAGAASAESSVGRVLELGDGLTLTVDELRRTEHNSVLFKFTLGNTGEAAVSPEILGGGGRPPVLSFLDFENRRRYRCIRSGVYCYGNRMPRRLQPGEAKKMWLHMTEPPQDINVLAIAISDLEPFEGFIIEQRL